MPAKVFRVGRALSNIEISSGYHFQPCPFFNSGEHTWKQGIRNLQMKISRILQLTIEFSSPLVISQIKSNDAVLLQSYCLNQGRKDDLARVVIYSFWV